MRPKDIQVSQFLNAKLCQFEIEIVRLPGLATPQNRLAFVSQLLESIHRIEYVKVISGQLPVNGRIRQISRNCIDPNQSVFDPLKAAVLEQSSGNHDNACWLVFLATHFGKNLHSGWALARNYYGQLGSGDIWDWHTIVADPKASRKWFRRNQIELFATGKFGNHRKYQSIDADKPNGTGDAIESYIEWVKKTGSHIQIIRDLHITHGQNPRTVFAEMYRQLDEVRSFGRTAKFDYLTMLGKLGLAPVEPGSTYMTGSTGPLDGARLLFGEPDGKPKTLDTHLISLGDILELPFSMQILEDALCNWQKSPAQFIPFRG